MPSLVGSEMCIRDRSYPWYHSVPKSLIRCCSGQDSCMLPSRCMLPSLRSAPYPVLCPCEPRRPVGDMQAVSCGARSRQYSRLLSASSSQPRSIVERAGLGPMGRVHIYRYIDILRSSDAPRSPSLARHPLCAGHREGLLCGKGVDPRRGRGRLSGARESQLSFGYIINTAKMFSKILLDITTTTTTTTTTSEENYNEARPRERSDRGRFLPLGKKTSS